MTFSFVDIENRRYIRDHEPDECPLCHFSVHADEKIWSLADSEEGPKRILEIVYQCPRRECGRYFVARYKRSDEAIQTKATKAGLGSPFGKFVFFEATPSSPAEASIPVEVRRISPLFPEIYAQAIAAEAFGLSQIAGVGYRKALEFLVKDYCISINKDAEEQIKRAFLSTCIANYVDSPQVKLCAERAAWLGNDETHYIRRWNDKDIENLKELLILTINWIHSSLLTRKYIEEMP